MTTVSILDISRWDDAPPYGDLRWDKAWKQGARGVILKSSQSNWQDKAFSSNYRACREAGFLRGVYHFYTYDMPPSVQAEAMLKAVAGDEPEMGYWLDFEQPLLVPCDAVTQLYNAVTYLRTRTQKPVGVYTSWGYWSDHGSRDKFWATVPLWIAHWEVKTPRIPLPWDDYRIWQFSENGDGKAYGMDSGTVDLNWYNGSLEDLAAWCRVSVPLEPPDTIISARVRVHISPSGRINQIDVVEEE